MRKILEEFYLGNLSPSDQSFIIDSAYGRAVQAKSDNEDKLTEVPEGEEKKLLLDLVNAQSVVDGATAVENFINGFRLGARIVIEVMSDEDGCLRDIKQTAVSFYVCSN